MQLAIEFREAPHGWALWPFFEPNDVWVGFYRDPKKRRIYFCPIPMFGLVLQYGRFSWA